jgi:KilA-N domain
MTPTSTLRYQGTPIRLRGAMLNLTDMWQAAGRPENRRPSDWLALEETQRFRAYAGEHWTEAEDPVANAGPAGICTIDTDGFVATTRGHQGGTWAHWQLALAYARYLSPQFHLWCNTVVRAAMERPGGLPVLDPDPVLLHLTLHFRAMHRRLDILDRHAADLMFLLLSAQDLLLGKRRDFSERSQAAITRVVAAEPFDGQCPCCSRKPVLTEAGRPAPGAEFDHFFHRGLNRPEHGWLVCPACHAELTHGGYLARFARLPEFRAFQAAVLEQRRRAQAKPGSPAQ